MNRPRPVATRVKRCVRSMREFPAEVLYDAGVPPALPVPLALAGAALPPTMIRERRALRARSAGIACAGAFAACATGQPLGVATWNVGWLMDEAAHARWTAACARNGWPRDTSALSAAERAALAPLPFCDVHNGMRFPPERCRAARDGWPYATRYPVGSSVPRHRRPRRVGRVRAQGRRAARDVPPSRRAGRGRWSRCRRCSTRRPRRRSCPPAGRSPRRASCRARRRSRSTSASRGGAACACATSPPVNALADGGVPGRPLRPGLAFTVDVGGKPVRALAVHLKAGCRSRDLDAPLGPADAKLPPERQDAIASDCAMLRYQLPALEAWIDAHAHRDFAVLGDFNRTLLREPVADSATLPDARRRQRARRTPSARARWRAPASAGSPSAAQRRARCFRSSTTAIPTAPSCGARASPTSRRAARSARARAATAALAGARGDLTHDGIDHVLVSESLKRRLEPSALTMRVENYRTPRAPRCAPIRRSRCRPITARTSSCGRRSGGRDGRLPSARAPCESARSLPVHRRAADDRRCPPPNDRRNCWPPRAATWPAAAWGSSCCRPS